MSTLTKLVSGLDFGTALCKRLGIDASKVSKEYTINCKPDDMLSVNLTVLLSPSDISAIGKIMED